MAHSRATIDHELTATVQTTYGPVRGLVDDGMQKFLGIPYAAPPIGNLRWRPPSLSKVWKEPLDTVRFGPVCAQTSACFPGFASDSSNEDCLYLNVFTPHQLFDDQGAKLLLPVMVWIHGGGFAGGASNDYNATALVNQGPAVVVTINYRVGVFGFFSHPAINAESHASGNYGIMDQQLALQWVQRNIENFGGDASNVTAFGESAGGASVLAHIAAPSSRGLFHKAIIQSGGSPPTMPFPTIETLEARGTALATAVGCTEQTAENLRRMSVEAIMAADALDDSVFGIGRFPFGLMEDGIIVPRNLREIFSRGEIHRVPMIVGVNRDEFAWFQAMMELRSGRIVSTEAYPETVANTIDLLNKLHLNGVTIPSHAIPHILEMYPVGAYGGNPSSALAAVVGDAGLISTAGRRTVRVLAEHTEIFTYEFDVPDTPCPWPEVSFPYGSAHTLELPYIFPGFHGASGSNPVGSLSKSQQRLADQMVHYWTQFAWQGTPNGEETPGRSGEQDPATTTKVPSTQEQPTWEAYRAEKDNVMLFQAAEPLQMIEGWGRRHNSDYWDEFY